MKDSRDRWLANRYSLVETGMSRQNCNASIAKNLGPHGLANKIG